METTVLRTFICIIDEGSFAAAARRMGISRSLCSKHIADLEADLGTRLLSRTTRAVRPTSLGLEYSHRIREVLRQLDAANETMREASAHPAGVLKIGASASYMHRVFKPHIMRFMDDYPDIQIEMVIDDNVASLVNDSYDAVIRIGTLEDSSFYARKLHTATIMLVASPDYLDRHGTPQQPTDLSAHNCLHYSNLRGAGTWPLKLGDEIIYQKIHPTFSTNDSELLHSLAVEGKGIALLPVFAIADDLVANRLVPLMKNFALPDVPVNLIYPTGKLMTAAMRRFLNFVTQLNLSENDAYSIRAASRKA